jgi:flagellar biosynthesis GTPase FlhF
MLKKLSIVGGIIVGTAAVLAHIISFQRSCEPFPMGQCIYQWITWATSKHEDPEALARHQKAQQAKEEAREAAAIAKAKADQAEAKAREEKDRSDEADRRRRVIQEAEAKKQAEILAQEEAARKLAATRAAEKAEEERRAREREEEERRRLAEIQRREVERRQIEEERKRQQLVREAEIASKTRWCETCCTKAYEVIDFNSRAGPVRSCVSFCATGQELYGPAAHCRSP